MRRIKEQIKNQILINQHLIDFEDTDSSVSDNQQKNHSSNIQMDKKNPQSKPQNNFEQMIKQRRQVLKQLSICSKINTVIHPNSYMKSQQSHSQQNFSQHNNSLIIIDLKSKLAQVLKESQQKSTKIQQLLKLLQEATSKIQKYEFALIQKQNQINSKNSQITQLHFQITKLQQEYHTRIKNLQQQLSKTYKTKSSQNEIMASETLKNNLNQLKNQIQLKNQQIKELSKSQDKITKLNLQNKKLKKDVQRLLLLVQKCAKKDYQQQHKHRTTTQNPIQAKQKKIRSISLGHSNLNEKKRFKTDCSSVKCSESTKNQQFEKSLISLNDKKNLSESSSCLIGQVQKFLKKWHVAQNNHKFVESLVDLIHHFTEQCIDQHKVKIQNHYKSLKKEMIRKANQSLNFHQIMKERQIKIKMNTSLNYQNQKVKSYKTQQQFNVKQRTISSDNLSILVPASNKKCTDKMNSQLLSASLLECKDIKKEDIGYNTLEKSIRFHKKMSKNNIQQKNNPQVKIKQNIESIFTQQNQKKSHRKSKTQLSTNNKKYGTKSSLKKRTKSQFKNDDIHYKNLR